MKVDLTIEAEDKKLIKLVETDTGADISVLGLLHGARISLDRRELRILYRELRQVISHEPGLKPAVNFQIEE